MNAAEGSVVAGDPATLPPALAQAGVVAAYGDPLDEYRVVREHAGVADRDDLAHLVLSGRDPVRMVQGLITNDLAGAPERRAVYGAMLTPKGRTIAEVRCWKEAGPQGAEVHLDLPREVLVAASDHLRRSVPPLYARWRDASEAVGTLGIYGPGSLELLREVLGAEVPALAEDDLGTARHGDAELRLIGTRYAGGESGVDVILDRPALDGFRSSLLAAGAGRGVRRVGFTALETLRIEAGRPRGGHELTEETIPTEAFESTGMMERAISFSKGCYTGQEVIVRIAHRGHVNRHLRGLVLDEQAPAPTAGARLHDPRSGKEVGWVTSSTRSPLLGRAVALAYVRREIEPGARLRVLDREATVAPLPFEPVGAA